MKLSKRPLKNFKCIKILTLLAAPYFGVQHLH